MIILFDDCDKIEQVFQYLDRSPEHARECYINVLNTDAVIPVTRKDLFALIRSVGTKRLRAKAEADGLSFWYVPEGDRS